MRQIKAAATNQEAAGASGKQAGVRMNAVGRVQRAVGNQGLQGVPEGFRWSPQPSALPQPALKSVMTYPGAVIGYNRPPRTEFADADIKKKYFEIVDQGPAHYVEAIQYLINVFDLDDSRAVLSYDPLMQGAYAITAGSVGDDLIPVRFGPGCFNKFGDFGAICRAVAHELLHTRQKAVLEISDHDEREFLAYYDSLTRTDMPAVQHGPTLRLYVTKALGYYQNLSKSKQIEYVSQKAVIEGIKAEHGF